MHALIVENDKSTLRILDKALRQEGLEVSQAGSIAEARKVLEKNNVDMVFLDIFLSDRNGMDLLADGASTMPVVMLTAETTVGHAAQACHIGAMEYLSKPLNPDEVRQLVQRVRPVERKIAAGQQQKEDLMIGRSPAMGQLLRTLGRVAASDLTVLITGESGAGKEVVARTLHDRSQRAGRPFIAMNTAAIPVELLESKLFGHAKGAFSGANSSRKGCFEQADGGTLLVDDIGDMPTALQAKLLRVLEEGRVQRIGGSQSKQVNVRLLTATHQHLPEKIANRTFREDLYYRLNVIPVHIPPLRERRDDIHELAHYLLTQAASELGMKAPILLDDAADLLSRHDWPGNVRELKNVMRRLAVLTPGVSITLSDVALALGNTTNRQQSEETLSMAVTRCTRQYLHQLGYAQATSLHQHLIEQVEPPLLVLAMERCAGNQLKVSEMLGLNRNTVRKLLRKYKIDPQYFRS